MVCIQQALILPYSLLLLAEKFVKVNFQHKTLLAIVAQGHHIGKNMLLMVPLCTNACCVELFSTRPETVPHMLIVTHGAVINRARHDSLTLQ